MSEGKKYYLTTPIYYVNAAPHIGHNDDCEAATDPVWQAVEVERRHCEAALIYPLFTTMPTHTR